MDAGLELFFLTAMAVITGAIGLQFMWIRHRFPKLRRTRRISFDPDSGFKDRAALHGWKSSHIPMPDHLRTKEEMVAWMIAELPKQTAEIFKPRV